jgi:hypothetical protein
MPQAKPGKLRMRELMAAWVAGDPLLEDDGLEPLGRGVDGRRQAGWSRADDHEVVEVGAQLRRAPDRLDELGVRRLNQHTAVMAQDHRQSRAVPSDLAQDPPARLRVLGVEHVRHGEPREQVADLVGARSPPGRRCGTS